MLLSSTFVGLLIESIYMPCLLCFARNRSMPNAFLHDKKTRRTPSPYLVHLLWQGKDVSLTGLSPEMDLQCRERTGQRGCDATRAGSGLLCDIAVLWYKVAVSASKRPQTRFWWPRSCSIVKHGHPVGSCPWIEVVPGYGLFARFYHAGNVQSPSDGLVSSNDRRVLRWTLENGRRRRIGCSWTRTTMNSRRRVALVHVTGRTSTFGAEPPDF